MQKIFFHNSDRILNIRNKDIIKKTIEQIYKEENKQLERLDYIFCSDEYLLDINKKYLQHDFYTDIVTFDLSEDNKKIIGEIYISLDRVKDNAQKLNIPFYKEVWRVIFHGSLHLCGYKDKKETEIKTMRSKEEYYISKQIENLNK